METQSKTIQQPATATEQLLRTLMSEVGSFESPDMLRGFLADMMEGYFVADLCDGLHNAEIVFAFRRLDNIVKLIGNHSQSVKSNSNQPLN